MSTISELFEKPASELGEVDIKEVIKFQRKERANFEAGIKPSKKDNNPDQIDSAELLDRLNIKKAPATPLITRRI